VSEPPTSAGSHPGAARDGDTRWGLVVGLLPVILLMAPRVLAWTWADRMPDPIAVHWSLGGAPNGSMSLAANEALSTFLGVLLWVIGAAMVRNARTWRVRRAVASFTAAVLALLSFVDVAVLQANLDQPSWQDAMLPGWAVLVCLAGAAVAGWAARALCGRPPTVDVPVGGLPLTDIPPSAGLPPGCVGAHWEGSSGNGWLAGLGIALGGALLIAAQFASWWLVLPAVLVLGAFLALSVLHVRCDGSGLTVRYGLLGWPVQRIGLDDIAVATAIDLDPAEWGGWGYRWAPGQSGTAAVTRRGPAIVVRRRDGRQFAVTVDDAVTGAGTLNDLRRDRSGQ
jgi:hypothetical protein